MGGGKKNGFGLLGADGRQNQQEGNQWRHNSQTRWGGGGYREWAGTRKPPPPSLLGKKEEIKVDVSGVGRLLTEVLWF